MKSGMNNFTSDMHSFRASIRPFEWIKKRQRSIVLSIVVLAITTTGSYAQSFHLGLKAGLNVDKLTGRSFNGKSQAGFNAGAFGELNFNSKWGIQPEILYSLTQASTSDLFGQIYPGGVSSNIQLNYITVPILLFFKPIPELSIQLGPQYGYLVNQTEGLLVSPIYPKDAFAKSDLAVVFGGQLNLGKIKLGARYTGGVVSINNINNSDNWKKQGFQLYLGYRIL